MSNASSGSVIFSDDEEMALFLAVLYHGLSSLHERAIPAKAETVVKTADLFVNHLRSKKSDNGRR